MPRTFLLSLPMPGPIDRGAGLCAAFFCLGGNPSGGAAAFGGRGAALGAAPRPAKQKARAGGFASGPGFSGRFAPRRRPSPLGFPPTARPHEIPRPFLHTAPLCSHHSPGQSRCPYPTGSGGTKPLPRATKGGRLYPLVRESRRGRSTKKETGKPVSFAYCSWAIKPQG